MTSMPAAFAAAAASLTLTLATGSVIAAPATYDEIRVAVSYSDLDLASPADAEILYARIGSAARRACELHEGRGVRAMARAQECRERAVAAAVARVNRPALTSLHANARSEGEARG